MSGFVRHDPDFITFRVSSTGPKLVEYHRDAQAHLVDAHAGCDDLGGGRTIERVT
jgi:hypothetical protein